MASWLLRSRVFSFGLSMPRYACSSYTSINTPIIPSDKSIKEDCETKKASRKRMNKYHNVRPHRNPLADLNVPYPIRPESIDWSKHFPCKDPKKDHVRFLDVGCGYGGLLVGLSTAFPNKLSVGLEIRDSVQKYVQKRIQYLREDYPGQYQNISVLQTNAMKFLTNHFQKGQVSRFEEDSCWL
eukprot:TRINITY_DN3065_c0_g2_i1.p1 TRINITY_DN3065_c0_g2~~TRINITY_DN3065_c0_g2_i1.p1  ORF type:complete len:183 (+),score=23.65 TRINITY_DN3065_c0_g2_i1:56-604(+)